MEQDRNLMAPRFRKAVDITLTTLGIALFIVLGARALSLVGDMKVAAGLKNKNTSIESTNTPLGNMASSPGALSLVSESSNNNKSSGLLFKQKPDEHPTTKQGQITLDSKEDKQLNNVLGATKTPVPN